MGKEPYYTKEIPKKAYYNYGFKVCNYKITKNKKIVDFF